ncbi:hypothetical protein BCR34DRAFT_606992 [Clohesyomyces aquaticus]|uniref:Uncharacterized protein n=1 Tax=Clohesyomyces aquaticus TaxID=1231657 RepID=A0A1Y1YJS4_9PLEO|nr:hypothetical protein BCR34DRAFT_606992 [Clohesyomyces aquaticus]
MATEGAGVDWCGMFRKFHQDAKSKAIAPLLEGNTGMSLIPYDGCAEFHVEDAAHFLKFMESIYNSKKLVGCGQEFVDMTKGYHIMLGYVNLILGQGVKDEGGKDGILKGDGRLKGKSNGDVNGKSNGDVNGKSNGDVNGKSNGDVNGKSNGDTIAMVCKGLRTGMD